MVHDAIVVGLGGIGSAAAYHLARRGLSVLGVEQFSIAHDRGSSHGQTRILRKAYFEHPDYVPLLHQAYKLWSELETASSRTLRVDTGLLLAGAPEGRVISGVRQAAHDHHLGIFDLEDVETRFPGFKTPDGSQALFETDAGFLKVETCVRTHVEQAILHGADLRIGVSVTDWEASPAGVTVVTPQETHHARKLIFCAGAWTGRLLPELGVPLTILRKPQLWFPIPEDSPYLLAGGCPIFGYELKDRFFYGFPSLDGRTMKIAEHTGGRPVEDPMNLDHELHAEDSEGVIEFVRSYLPNVLPEVSHHQVCMYTMSPDSHFIVDQHPGYDNVFLVGGLSGHGFKFAPVLGSVIADWAESGGIGVPIELFRLKRFQG